MSAAAHTPPVVTADAIRNGTIKSVFAHLDCLVDAIDAIKREGVKDFTVTAPLPRHEIEELIYGGKPSPIRWFTLCGAIFGGTFGFSLCSFTHLNWAMIIPAGKPLVSIPPFMVITFESTVLWGCLFTLVGMLLLCRLPANDLQPEVCDPRFSDDVFGLVINNLGRKQAERIAEILRQLGATEVRDGYTESSGPERKPVPLEEMGVEPDSPNTHFLTRIAVVVTIVIIAVVLGVAWFFRTTVSEELKAKGYSTPERAVNPEHRPND